MAVAVGLQIARDRRERGTEQGRGEDRGDRQRVARQEAEVKRGERGPEAGDVGLALDPDVEQAGVEAERDREAGEDEARRVIEREADALEIAERAPDQDLHRLERVLADGEHDEAGDDEGGGDVDQRDQRDVSPLRQGLEGRAHAASFSRYCSRTLHSIGVIP